MKKTEVVELVKELTGAKTKKEAEATIALVATLVDAISEKLAVDEFAKLGNVKIAKVHVEARTGEITKKDKTKKAWSKPAYDKIVLKKVK